MDKKNNILTIYIYYYIMQLNNLINFTNFHVANDTVNLLNTFDILIKKFHCQRHGGNSGELKKLIKELHIVRDSTITYMRHNIDICERYINDQPQENKEFPLVMLFYSETCTHCNSFKPIWNEFKRITNKKLLSVKQTNDHQMMKKYDISGVPTILLFPTSYDTNIEYKNDRNIDDLCHFVNTILKSNISTPFTGSV